MEKIQVTLTLSLLDSPIPQEDGALFGMEIHCGNNTDEPVTITNVAVKSKGLVFSRLILSSEKNDIVRPKETFSYRMSLEGLSAIQAYKTIFVEVSTSAGVFRSKSVQLRH